MPNYVPAHALRKKAQKAVEKLQIDAAASGLTIDELEIDKSRIEQYIFDAVLHLQQPGTLSD